MIVWGCHRDTVELKRIGFPKFSYGTHPAGSQRLDPRDQDALTITRFGDFKVGREDVVFADTDGFFLPRVKEPRNFYLQPTPFGKQSGVKQKHYRPARSSVSSFSLTEYLAQRSTDPAYTFHRHLRDIGGIFEE